MITHLLHSHPAPRWLSALLLILASSFAWAGDEASLRAKTSSTVPTSAVRQRTTISLASLPGRSQQQLARLGALEWRRAGYAGQGIKVAILDSGFRGYRAHLGKALPDTVQVRSFRGDGNLEAKDSQHGILCGEVVHALAPEAELLFANWDPDRPEQFLRAARWAREQGAQLISCSVIMPSWSDGEGGGENHAALSRILGDGSHRGDVLCFASAGNTARRHWCGSYRAAADGFHEWRPGLTGNVMTPWGSERASAELYWQPGPDYDLFVIDRDTGQEVGHCLAGTGTERCSAVVHVNPKPGHAYQVRVRLARGPAGKFHLTALNSDLEYGTSPGSVSFPADGAEVIAMGAVDSQGVRQNYSSCGPNSTKPKPDFVAPVPFASSWRARSFSGTSAAAPEAAALTALLWSHYPDWHADKIRAALYASAHDLGAPGPDWETGYGLIELPRLDRARGELIRPASHVSVKSAP